jgi:undecaprenyl pyrophosphate phosphatase UppP
MGETAMAQRNKGGQDRRERLLVNGLWIAAAAMVVAGFVLRILASLLARADLRITGVALIAIGLAVAVIGWLSERFVANRTP